MADHYYRSDLSLIHHLGFGSHAQLVAPGVLALLEPVLARRGLVLELGCGSGALTRFLVEAGHRVIATDASPAMLQLATDHAAGAEEFRQLVMPDDPYPVADAVVSVGHPLNYLPDAAAIDRALVAAAEALRPDGVLVVDLCDLEWGRERKDAAPQARVGAEWALFTEFATPAPDRFDRRLTTFVRNDDGTYRRDREIHENVLVETSLVPVLLAEHGVAAEVRAAFGDEMLPVGLKAIVGERRS
jgi:SAM-dependent methyltransferase